MMHRGYSIRRVGRVCILALTALVLSGGTSLAAGIRVVPSVERVQPGDDFFLDVVAENIPVDDGLGTVQFRLNVAAPGAKVAGVSDLVQAASDSVSVATPLLTSGATASRSGLGEFFGSAYQGSGGVLMLDNETLQNGSALFTYAHTHGANRPAGTGVVARFLVHVGATVGADKIEITLSDVLLLDGGPAYSLDSNVGATVTLRCSAVVPDLAGKSLNAAQSALTAAGLVLENVYEVNNADGTRPLGVVLEQSLAAGANVDCESPVNIAINTAPVDVSGITAVDKVGDDTGAVLLAWTPSPSSDAAGYRVYRQGALLREVAGAQVNGIEVDALANGVNTALLVKSYDSHGNLSNGVTVNVQPLDDVAPVINLSGVADGVFYNTPVQPQLTVDETNQAAWTVLLDGAPYDLTPVSADGSHTLTVTARDAAGNETTRSLSFTIDRTAPDIGVANLVEGGHYSSEPVPSIVIADANLHEAQTVLTLDGQAYLSGTAVTGEGPHTLALSAHDRAGNSASLTLHFTLDKTAPDISVQGVADGAFYNGEVVPQIGIADLNLEASTILLNGQAYLSGTPLDTEGEYLLSVSGRDKAGNQTEATLRFVIDKTVPGSSATIGSPSFTDGENLYLASAASVTLTATDGGVVPSGLANISYALDQTETWNAYVSSMTLGHLPEGAHHLFYRATDRAGNREDIRTLTAILDATAPVTTLLRDGVAFVGEDGTLILSSGTSYALASSDNLSGVAEIRYQIDAGPWSAGATVRLSELSAGAHTIAFYAVDRVDNRETEQTLSFTLDNTAPVTGLSLGDPHLADGDKVYLSGATPLSLTASDDLAGVASSEYRVDGGTWQPATAPFSLALLDGEHTVAYRSTDRVGNVETEQLLNVVVDNAAPYSEVNVDYPQFRAGGVLYVGIETLFTLTATDVHSGVAAAEYRIDGGNWQPNAAFHLLTEGEHRVEYRSLDRLGHQEALQTFVVVTDVTPPTTRVSFSNRDYSTGETVLVTADSEAILAADDLLSGVRVIQYRFDQDTVWHDYLGAIPLADLAAGAHLLSFRSVDQVDNEEAVQTVALARIGITVESSILNLPRVLVWTQDPAEATGKNRSVQSLNDIQNLLTEAFDRPDTYFRMVTDKNVFRDEMRSGIYNVIMILDIDSTFDTVFLRELREAVHRGTGLLVSRWGNNLDPLLQELFGVDFRGAVVLDENSQALTLYQSPLAESQHLAIAGKVLKTRLAGGTLAGIIPADSLCGGVKSLALAYPVEVGPGDRITATLTTPQGKKSVLVDEEQLSVEGLPTGPFNRSVGNAAGDLALSGISAEGITLAIAAPYGYLAENYSLTITVDRLDGSRTTSGQVNVTPICSANLQPGTPIGPLTVITVDEDRTRSGEDLPAVVMGEYGQGKTAFLAYDLLGSALTEDRSAHLAMLGRAAAHLAPTIDALQAGGVALIETKLRLDGSTLDVKAEEVLGEGLKHLPLFSLTKSPLVYTFTQHDGATAAYRYFVRVADRAGLYGKETGVTLGLDGNDVLSARYHIDWNVASDSALLMQQAMLWVGEQTALHPEVASELRAINDALQIVASMPRSNGDEVDRTIHQIVQIIHQVGQLSIDADEMRNLLGEYLRIVEGEGYLKR